jgi:uncharacterized cupredoxin-like copper-binding protein
VKRAIAACVSLAAAVAPSCAAHHSPSVVVLTISHSHFTPAHVRVPAGLVRFVVRNHDPIDHELIVGDEATQARHEAGTDTHHDEPGAVSVGAGTSSTTTVVLQPGALLFGCHLPGHWQYGMRGTATVTGRRVPGGVGHDAAR